MAETEGRIPPASPSRRVDPGLTRAFEKCFSDFLTTRSPGPRPRAAPARASPPRGPPGACLAGPGHSSLPARARPLWHPSWRFGPVPGLQPPTLPPLGWSRPFPRRSSPLCRGLSRSGQGEGRRLSAGGFLRHLALREARARALSLRLQLLRSRRSGRGSGVSRSLSRPCFVPRPPHVAGPCRAFPSWAWLSVAPGPLSPLGPGLRLLCSRWPWPVSPCRQLPFKASVCSQSSGASHSAERDQASGFLPWPL